MLNEIKTLIADLLEQAKKNGVDAAEASVSQQKGLSVTARLGDVETVSFHQDKSLSVTVYKKGKKGSASTTDLNQKSILDTLHAAVQIAQFTEEDPYAGLLERTYLATKVLDLDLFHPYEMTTEEAIQRAKKCEQSAREFDPRMVNSEGATWTDVSTIQAYGNTNGFIGGYPSTRYSLSCSMVAKSDQSMERDYDYSVARNIQDLQSEEYIGLNTAQKTLSRLHPRKIQTTQAPVIFSAELASGFFGHFIAAISGGSLYRRSSFLCDHLGKKIFPDFLQIEEYPHLLKGLASAPYDHEGAATRDRQLVNSGVLEGYVLSGYSARKLGLKTTANAGGIHNVVVSHQDQSLEQLIKAMGRGLLVTELIGQGVNVINGDYSRGAFGYWVEQGEIQYPVHEITIAGNLTEMFASIQAIGNDVDPRSAILSGSIWVDKMTIAGA